jgi:trk system potassium uptake protein TrkH
MRGVREKFGYFSEKISDTFGTPLVYPLYYFVFAIFAGAFLLHLPASNVGPSISWIDAVFTATSATCVTGLAVLDTGADFSRFGHCVILGLIQLGGLGVMTYASLAMYLWRNRISLADRLAVGQSLLHDPSFKLGRFLLRLLLWTLAIEGSGMLLLRLSDPVGFSWFSSLFHSVSAFCNAGFSLQSDSLSQWRSQLGVNFVIMVLIVAGGIGFSVLVELGQVGGAKLGVWKRKTLQNVSLSWYSKVVLKTSIWLVLLGGGALFFAEFVGYHQSMQWGEAALSALFQSVTCRTAGFNTLDIGAMTNLSLVAMMALMLIGGSPGSCAGGVKTTTFRTLTAFVVAQLRGREQSVVSGRALDASTLRKAFTLALFAFLIITCATLILTFTEGGDIPHPEARGQFLELLFESVSAFATVGVSTGLTPGLSTPGKVVVTLLMLVGRLGPVFFLGVLQTIQEKPRYRWPEDNMLIG